KQTLKCHRRNHAEINCRDGMRMIVQECPPALRRWSPVPDHVLGDCRLGDFEAKFEQLTVDTRRTPQWVLPAHLPNEFAQLTGNPGPTRSPAGFPAPVGSKPCSMPAQDRVRLNDAS